MTRIDVAGGWMTAEVLGWHKLWAFKSRLVFPLDHVAGARRWDKERDGGFFFRGIRAPGTHFPGVIVAGTYHRRREHLFYDVCNFKRAVVIELREEWYARLIVEVAEPETAVNMLRPREPSEVSPAA